MAKTRNDIQQTLNQSEELNGKPSFLYHFIDTLRNKSHPAIQDFHLTPIQDAFLIHIRNPLQENWVSKLIGTNENLTVVRMERHFRIDKIYQNSSSTYGLTPIHYTETYRLLNGQLIVAHAFLDKKRKYLYSHIKFFENLNRTSNFQSILVDKALEDAIKSNMQLALINLTPIFEEWNEECFKQLESIALLKKELDFLSQFVYNDKKSFESYHQKFSEIIEAMNVAQKMGENTNAQRALLCTVHDGINLWYKKIQQAEISLTQTKDLSSSSASSSSQAVLSKTSNPENNPDERLKNLLEEAVKDLQKYNSSIDKSKLENLTYSKNIFQFIQKRHEIIEKADNLWWVISGFLSRKISNKKEEKVINKLLSDINEKSTKHYIQCQKLLEESFFNGETEQSTALFELLKHYLNLDFYESLILKIMDFRDLNLQQNLIIICDHFYENSSAYKSAVLRLSQEKMYSLSKTEAMSIHQKIDTPIKVSLLYKAYYDQNISIFKMLLRHGADANSFGIHAQTEKSSISLLYSIGAYYREGYLHYLKELLEANADPNLIYTREMKNTANKNKLANLREEKKAIEKAKQTLRNGVAIAAYTETNTATLPPLMAVMAHVLHREGLNFLLPYATTEAIAYALGLLSQHSTFNIRRFFSPEMSVVYFAENAIEMNAQYNIFCVEKTTSPYLSFMIYPNGNHYNGVAEDLIDMKTLHKVLRNQIEMIKSSKEIQLIYEKLFQYGKDSFSKKEYVLAYGALQGCEFLLAEASQQLDKNERINFHPYFIELSNLMIKLTNEARRDAFKSSIIDLYKIRLAEISDFGKKNKNAVLKTILESVVNKSLFGTSLLREPISNLAHYLGSIAANDEFMMACVMTKKPDLIFTRDESECWSILTKIEELSKKPVPYDFNTPFYTFVFYPNEEESNSSTNNNTKNDYAVAKSMYTELIKKIKALTSDKQFDFIYRELFCYGCSQLSQGNVKKAQTAFQGCETLLVAKSSLLDAEDTLNLFKKYIPKLGKAIISMYELKYTGPEDAEILGKLIDLHHERIDTCEIVFDSDERNIISKSRKVVYTRGIQFLISHVDEVSKDVVKKGITQVLNVLDRMMERKKNSWYDSKDDFSVLKSVSDGVSNTMLYGYDCARQIAILDKGPDRKEYVLSKEADKATPDAAMAARSDRPVENSYILK